jgi:hypothetical protein
MRPSSYRCCGLMLLVCSVIGCSASQDSESAAARDPSPTQTFVNKAWRVAQPADAPLGSLYVFFSNGTLMQTSCVEVYRLSTWRPTGERSLTITEDTARIDAEVEPGERRMRLRLKLGGEWQPWKSLELLDKPFLCPDLRR